MQDADWKKDSASHQETPEPLSKASKDMGQPSSQHRKANDVAHQDSFTKMPSEFM